MQNIQGAEQADEKRYSPTVCIGTKWRAATARRPSSSPLLRPFLPRVENGDDLEAIASQPVGDDVRCSGDNQFSGAGDAARTAKIGQFSEALDSLEQCPCDSVAGVRIVARDVLAEMSQMLDGSRRPDDGHTRGAFRSRLRPHERSQFATSLCGTPRPSSSSLMPV